MTVVFGWGILSRTLGLDRHEHAGPAQALHPGCREVCEQFKLAEIGDEDGAISRDADLVDVLRLRERPDEQSEWGWA